MSHTEKRISASIRARLNLIGTLRTLAASLQESARVIGGITDDMARSAAELKDALDRI